MSGVESAAELLRIIGGLIGVMEREIEMLRSMRPAEMQGLLEEKIVLSAAYQTRVATFQADGAVLAMIDPELRRSLLAAIEKFRDTLAANERHLRAAKETTDRVLRAVAAEIEKERGETAGYSADGAVQAPAVRQPVSVAINQQL